MNILHKLFEIGAVKFGSFTLKSGVVSPIYIDLRIAISYPKLLAAIAEALYAAARGIECDLICGVPYTALPFATAISLQHNIPMVLRRKEKKEYGTKKIVEGVFQKGQRCLIIEDVVTSGASIAETAEILKEEGLVVNDAIVFVDREQGGVKNLAQKGIRLRSVYTITSIVNGLLEEKIIDAATASSIHEFLRTHQTA